MFKNIVTIFMVIALIFVMFVPVWATEDNSSVSTEIPVASIEETEVETETETNTEESSKVIKSVEVSPERVMDYTKMYHVATVSVVDCAKIKWYFITADGLIYNMGSVNEHHDATYEIVWNSLDINGKHPAGAWNKPTTVRFSLVIVATSISGEEEAFETWFEYSWYDAENSVQVPASNPTAVTTPKTSDVPHTGL